MKWIKRLLLAVALLLVVTLLVGACVYRQIQTTPERYKGYTWTGDQRALLAERARDKVGDARNMAARAQADADARAYALKSGRPLPATVAVQPLTQTFTEEEINACLGHYTAEFNAQIDPYVTQPGIYFENGCIVFAGKIRELDKVLSVHYRPAIDGDGKLRLDMAKIMLGSRSIPRVVVASQLDRVASILEHNLPAWQRSARINASGEVNTDAAAAAMAKLLVHSLKNEPSPAVLMVPTMEQGNRFLPVRLTQVSIEESAMTISVEPFPADQRQKLIEQIKKD